MMSVCVRGEYKRWGECLCEKENQGVFSQQALHAFLPCMCVYRRPMKRVGVCVFAWKRNSSMHALPHECPRACICV